MADTLRGIIVREAQPVDGPHSDGVNVVVREGEREKWSVTAWNEAAGTVLSDCVNGDKVFITGVLKDTDRNWFTANYVEME